jgi:hypothetical protein
LTCARSHNWPVQRWDANSDHLISKLVLSYIFSLT